MELTHVLQTADAALPAPEKQKRIEQLEHYINNLIHNDFSQLVQLLYTVDVDEQGLKNALQQQPEQDAAHLIANLVWIRAEEKARARRQFTKPPPQDSEERW